MVALTALTSLNLRECRLITNDGLRRLEPLVQLKAFSMSNCTSVTDKGLQSLAKLTGGRGSCLHLAMSCRLAVQYRAFITKGACRRELLRIGCS